MAAFEGRGKCACCAAQVDVYSDKNGLAYYKCGPCGVKVTHSKAAKSGAFLGAIDRHADQDEKPPAAKTEAKKPPAVPPVTTEKTQEKTAFKLFGK